ncbi:MAG: type IV pilus assembly protein PilM [Patescibacteria group bacterium]|nr:type IV pilus assembly protein PilM [Patescibacteria group bacterium]
MSLFSSSDDKFLGIDIGDSSLKIVELSKKGKKIVLSNYGLTDTIPNFRFSQSDDMDYLARSIVKLKNELGIKTNKATASLSSFSVFSSVININNYDKKKVNERITEEARKVVPLPLEEMVLDWKIIPNKESDPNNNVKVFLTGSPKKLIKKYIEVFKKTGIFLSNLETETFSLIRSLLGDDPSSVMIIQLGANSTNFSIVKESIPFLNRSINISGKTITAQISEKMGITMEQAEQFKFDLSVSDITQKGQIPKVIFDAIEPIIVEIKYMLDLFSNSNGGTIEKIILSGGGSLLFNLDNYLENYVNIKTIIGDPWFRVDYPLELKPILEQIGPKLGVAVGLALRDAE